jgi:hypothetical protein
MNQYIPGNYLVKIMITLKTLFNRVKIIEMAIYHKLYNLVKRLYQNFTILLFSPVKCFYLTLKRLENCR